MCNTLRRQGHRVNRKRIRRLMKKMGLQSVAPGPNTSKPASGHKIYPYLLRKLRHRSPQSSVVYRYHLHPARCWFCLFSGSNELVRPKSSVVGGVR